MEKQYFIHSVRQLNAVQFEVLIGNISKKAVLLSCVISISELLNLTNVATLIELYL